ncbi:MAG: MFS transporter [Thermomicrobiales bacterium]
MLVAHLSCPETGHRRVGFPWRPRDRSVPASDGARCPQPKADTAIDASDTIPSTPLDTPVQRDTATPHRTRATAVILAGLIVTALNLRIVINALALVLDEIRETTGVSSAAAGLLTTLPILCFGLVAPFAPRIAGRIGLDRALILAMLGLIAGTLIRIIPSTPILFAGTAVVGLGIGIANVLLPASIKRDFPNNAGTMTGLLSMMMSLSGTIGVGLTIPLQDASGLGWRGTIALWAIPAMLAVAALTPRLGMHLGGRVSPASPAAPVTISLWHDPLAWQVTLMMGLQAFVFYSIATWFPTMMLDEGVAKADAGLYLSVANFAGMFSSFLVPMWASRRHNQQAFILGTSVLLVLSLTALLVSPTSAPLLWMLVFGLAVGSALSLAIAFFSLRSPDVHHAAHLSGMAQFVGYCLAASGPFLIGVLHDATGGWHVPLLVVLGAVGAMTVAGMGAARNRYVGS